MSRAPKWADAIPSGFDLNDDTLKNVATLGPRVLQVCILQMLHAVGIPPVRRAAILSQLIAQLNPSVDKRRLYEAERIIKGESRKLGEPIRQGLPLQPRAANQDGTRPTPRRGKVRTK